MFNKAQTVCMVRYHCEENEKMFSVIQMDQPCAAQLCNFCKKKSQSAPVKCKVNMLSFDVDIDEVLMLAA